METSRYLNPAWWAADEAEAPGETLPSGVELPGWVWFRTSGSSGEPKWVGLKREALLLSAAMVNRHLAVRTEDVWGLALPLRHVGGFGVVARAYEGATKLAQFPGKWDASRFVAWLETARVSHCPLVPAQVHDLVTAGLRAPSCLRSVVVGGGRFDRELAASARQLGWPVLASYGMTEAASQIATEGLEILEKPYFDAPLPVLPHWQVGVDAQGRIELSGPALFSGVLTGGPEGWRVKERVGDTFLTSDRGIMEPGGLRVLGRVDRVVKILGELVDLDALETALGTENVVLDLPELRRGRELVVVGTDESLGDLVMAYNQGVAGPWRVARCVRVEALPRTPLGKPDRRALRAMVEGQEI
ncbi:MAG: AMP-binding protein [Akkermansiaceae bacterium]|jgi:O-succinylbenzoic acid--CoA ligase|nr:AMP-binding protein [Akkermansiaceae bacterium]